MAEFSAASAAETVRRACRAVGLDGRDLRLVRLGENAVFRLPGVVARVSRTDEARAEAEQELRVAAWLASVGVPAVRAVAGVAQPVAVDGRLVTFWEEIPDPEPSSVVELARWLRRLHGVPAPRELDLPPVRPFVRVEERIASVPGLADRDREFLAGMLRDLRRAWPTVTFELPAGVVHGDAHTDNLVRGADGRLAFLDLERFGVGQPEWDLTLTAVYHECGWYSGEQYAAFAEAYGYDVRTSPAWPVLRGIRMLRMTTWLAMTASQAPERAAELDRRLATLRDGTAPAGWNGF